MTPRSLLEPARLAGGRLLRGQSDERLVDLVRAGHPAAFEAIVARYRRPLLRYCRRLLPDARAEDAVQQAFANAHAALVRSDAAVELRPWLYRIAWNASLNMLRERGFDNLPLSEDVDGVERPEQVVERRERLASVLAAVRSLPERQRDAIVLRELEGRSYEEIAVALGVGDGAVRQLLHRARAGVRAAAGAFVPVGFVERVLALGGGEGAGRAASEAGAGAGLAAAAVKLSAVVAVTGAVVGGGVAIRHDSAAPHRAPRPLAERVARPGGSVAVPAAAAATHDGRGRGEGSEGAHRGRRHGGDDGRSRSRHGQGGSGGHGGAGERSGPGGGGSSGDDPAVEVRHRGRGGDDTSGSDDHSGSGSDGRSPEPGDDRSGGGGGGGSDDTAVETETEPELAITAPTPTAEEDSGGLSSGSGSGGSGSSGSGNSGGSGDLTETR